MNKDNAKDYLPLVQALAEGRVIQSLFFEEGRPVWGDWGDPDFTLPATRYRIKPEPRKAWVWWPASPLERAAAYEIKADAMLAVELYGGHITEVTE